MGEVCTPSVNRCPTLSRVPDRRRKSHTEIFLEGLEQQIQSGQAVSKQSKEETEKLKQQLEEWSSQMLCK